MLSLARARRQRAGGGRKTCLKFDLCRPVADLLSGSTTWLAASRLRDPRVRRRDIDFQFSFALWVAANSSFDINFSLAHVRRRSEHLEQQLCPCRRAQSPSCCGSGRVGTDWRSPLVAGRQTGRGSRRRRTARYRACSSPPCLVSRIRARAGMRRARSSRAFALRAFRCGRLSVVLEIRRRG